VRAAENSPSEQPVLLLLLVLLVLLALLVLLVPLRRGMGRGAGQEGQKGAGRGGPRCS